MELDFQSDAKGAFVIVVVRVRRTPRIFGCFVEFGEEATLECEK